MEENIITLVDEAGVEHDFTVLEVIDVDEVQYAILLLCDEPEEGVLVLKIGKDSHGEDVLMTIDNEEEFERVKKVIEQLSEEE